MYRITILDRNYSSFKVLNNETGINNENDDINPIVNKLFNFDTFNVDDNGVQIVNSPVRDTSIAGVLILTNNITFGKHKKTFLYKFIPDDKRLPVFLVPYKQPMGFSKNAKNRYIIVYFKDWDNKHPIALIDQNLGETGDLSSFYQYQLYCRSLNSSIQKFTKETKNKIKLQQEKEIIESMMNRYNTIDRRNEAVITIDPKNSKDFDDGFSCNTTHDDYDMLTIFIANVPVWMDYHNLWGSFSKRIATIYLPDRKLPMLPTVLSDILCSLKENCNRFALALDIKVEKNTGTIMDYNYSNVIIRVGRNYDYECDGLEKDKTYKSALELVKKINKKRKYICKVKNSHNFITYLMILMNHISAETLSNQKKGIFRSMSFSKIKDTEKTENDDINKFLETWHSSGGNYNKYDTLQSHDALNLDKYMHITSPIRRLVDLLNITDLQISLNVTDLTDNGINFYKSWTTDENITFINTTMRSIRIVQNECFLLKMCVETDVVEKIHKGYIFDKMQRSDVMFQYQVYLFDIKIVKKLISVIDLDPNKFYNFKLYLFLDEERMYRKIRINVV